MDTFWVWSMRCYLDKMSSLLPLTRDECLAKYIIQKLALYIWNCEGHFSMPMRPWKVLILPCGSTSTSSWYHMHSRPTFLSYSTLRLQSRTQDTLCCNSCCHGSGLHWLSIGSVVIIDGETGMKQGHYIMTNQSEANKFKTMADLHAINHDTQIGNENNS